MQPFVGHSLALLTSVSHFANCSGLRKFTSLAVATRNSADQRPQVWHEVPAAQRLTVEISRLHSEPTPGLVILGRLFHNSSSSLAEILARIGAIFLPAFGTNKH